MCVLLFVGFVDPGNGVHRWGLGPSAWESLGVGFPGVCQYGCSLGINSSNETVVNLMGSVVADPAVKMNSVIPLEESGSEHPCLFDRVEPGGEIRAVFQRFELGLRVRIVVGDMRSGMRLTHI